MWKKKCKWSFEVSFILNQEDKLLKQLKEKQNSKNVVCWASIAQATNIKLNTTKTPKKCRERYINCLKFEQDTSKPDWSEEELNLFV